jgi:CBS domain containing-hemolysin-like protein
MVYLHVVIGEMVPKNLALASPNKTAIILTPPLVLFVKVTRPIVVSLNYIANAILKMFKIKSQKELPSTFTRDEVAGFVEESKREGLITEDEGYLLLNAMKSHEKLVSSVMISLNKLVIASIDSTPADIEKMSASTGFSRFPIKNSDGVTNHYIHLKDILNVDKEHYTDPIPTSILRPLTKITSRTTLRTALALMQKSGSHLACVIDKKHNIIGILALEDLLEEFVGEIRDDSKAI